jgi:plasmid stabilization system protein ParE
MKVVFRAESLADLEEITAFVSKQHPQAAARIVERIHRVIYRTLCTLPLGGRLNRANGTREYAVPGLPYLIVYLPGPDTIDIVGVFHTSRDPAAKPRP